MNLIFNVRAFYLFFIVVMIASMAAIGLGTGLPGGTGGGVPRPPEEASPTPESTPISVKTYEKEPEMDIDSAKQYFAVIKTAKGDIRIELFADKAPRAVNSFVFLAQKEKFYDGLTFFWVVPEFALAGDPTCDAAGEFRCQGDRGPGYLLPVENKDASHEEGAVALAAPRLAEGLEVDGGLFYILYQPLPNWDGKDTVFGQVTADGMAVLRSLTEGRACLPGQEPTQEDPCYTQVPDDHKIISITIEEKGANES